VFTQSAHVSQDRRHISQDPELQDPETNIRNQMAGLAARESARAAV